MQDNVRALFAEIGELKADAEDFRGKHDRGRTDDYVEHLSREFKRLNRIVEYQNLALETLLDEDAATELRRILDEPAVRGEVRGRTRGKIRGAENDGCQIACETCYFDIDGCATACTEEVY